MLDRACRCADWPHPLSGVLELRVDDRAVAVVLDCAVPLAGAVVLDFLAVGGAVARLPPLISYQLPLLPSIAPRLRLMAARAAACRMSAYDYQLISRYNKYQFIFPNSDPFFPCRNATATNGTSLYKIRLLPSSGTF